MKEGKMDQAAAVSATGAGAGFFVTSFSTIEENCAPTPRQ
jgi:hypothetical protein